LVRSLAVAERLDGGLFLVALLIDVIYEIIVFRWVSPVQALIVSIVLALPPYVLVRGLTNRFVPMALAKRR
jgi:tryptophan-rich sensory protein